MASALSAKYFHDEEAAYAYVEARVWPEGPTCPHCGGVERIGKLAGKSTRTGVYKCYQCRKPFTVKIGTIFEASHVPLHIWLQAIYLVAGSKKGISSDQLHRTLGVTLKTAWFMSHRIREAMREATLAPMGGAGKVVEIDETFIGVKPGATVRTAYHHKMAVLTLVERGSGKARSMVVDSVGMDTVTPIIRANLAEETRVMTDEAPQYRYLNLVFTGGHGKVHHSAHEYGRDIHTNTIEGFFSIFKRGMKGRLSALRAQASAPLSCGVRFPLHEPDR